MKKTDNTKPQHTSQDFPVVGIGASAGGLDAFRKLLSEVPPDSGMAYVIVQHLSPDYDSNLTEILDQVTQIPVHEIINDINLAPNNIYVIPENSILTTNDGVLKLASRERFAKRNMAIDVFFESLAEVHKTFAIGVVLSGTAFDGTMGLKKIKEVGGVTIAQDPDSAAYKGMPQSAIDSDAVDYILPPEKIPAQLLKIYNTFESNHAYVDESESIPKDDDDVLRQIIKIIHQKTGNDFIHYKQPTIRRRIARRMVITKKEEMRDYLNFLRNDKAEQDLLFNDFLIPVSYFFRDDKVFEMLKEIVFPSSLPTLRIKLFVSGLQVVQPGKKPIRLQSASMNSFPEKTWKILRCRYSHRMFPKNQSQKRVRPCIRPRMCSRFQRVAAPIISPKGRAISKSIKSSATCAFLPCIIL